MGLSIALTYFLLLALEPSSNVQAPLQESVDYRYVVQDAGAGGYEAFPDICRLKDGRLICVFYAGYEHVSLPNEQYPLGGRISACFSDDEGSTWSEPVVVYDGADDDRDPSITQLDSGEILCTFFALRRKGSESHYRGLGSWLIKSPDNAKTWSEPQLISPYYCSSPVRQLSSGTLILGLYFQEGEEASGAVTLSANNGKTWSLPIDIPTGGRSLDAETDIIELKDGRLYAVQRPREGEMAYSTSSDDGKTWSESKPIGFPGHCPYLHRAPDDTIICAHRLPKTSLHFSRDECQTWSENVLVDDVIGAYPSMVTLKDDSILIVYYEEGERSNIRARKFRMTEQGVEWLRW